MRLSRSPDTTYGVDLVYVSADVLSQQQSSSTIIDGLPVLCAESLSPSEKQSDVDEKVERFLAAGVPPVWLINPRLRTVVVFRPAAEPEMFNTRHTLANFAQLPGFEAPAAHLFESLS